MRTQLSKPNVIVDNPKLERTQRSIALATILIPTVGTLIALTKAYFYGIHSLEIGLFIVFFILTNLGIEFGFHRNLAHKAFETTSIIGIIFAILGSMAGQGRVIYWVANHRRHHVHSDTVLDPHSPRVRKTNDEPEQMSTLNGLWHAHIGHMLSDKITNCSLFAADLNRNVSLVTISQYYFVIVIAGVLLPGLIDVAFRHSFEGFIDGILWGGLVRMFLVHQVTWSVASITHRFGSARFETNDHSANNLWIALPSFGSGWQNNHHAFPFSAYIGLKWWEIDITGWLIRILSWSRLAWNVKKPTQEQIAAKLSSNNKNSSALVDAN